MHMMAMQQARIALAGGEGGSGPGPTPPPPPPPTPHSPVKFTATSNDCHISMSKFFTDEEFEFPDPKLEYSIDEGVTWREFKIN